jgi:flagellar biosynthesis/type III secretory pathway protein FliH
MTYIVLHADQAATALVDDPVIPSAELRALNSAIALFAEAGQLRADAERRIEQAREQARTEGHAEGLAQGLAAARDEVAAELFRLAMRDSEERRARQQEISTLALEVVRRIAGTMGEEQVLIGLAERTIAALAPNVTATVRVPPAHAKAVRARLAGRDSLSVEADPTLSGMDCVVETPLGRHYAGLERQLALIEAAWREAAHG